VILTARPGISIEQQFSQLSLERNFLLAHGLPPMSRYGGPSSSQRSSVSQNREAAEGITVQFADCPPVLFEKLKTEARNNADVGRVIWSMFRSQTIEQFAWGSESDVASLVKTVIQDVANTLQTTLGPKYILSIQGELEIDGNRPDAWTLRRHFRPVGVIEVKVPGTNPSMVSQNRGSGSGLLHEKVLGAMFDYLMTLRSFDGITNAYGILSNYREWIFCCLEDTAENAGSQDMPERSAAKLEPDLAVHQLLEMPNVESTRAVDDIGDQDDDHECSAEGATTEQHSSISRRLCISRCYKWDDPKLVPTMAFVLMKMAYSPATRLQSVLQPTRIFRIVNEAKFYWQYGLKAKDVNWNCMPSPTIKEYALLLVLGSGISGVVYLATTTRADSRGEWSCCALKFTSSSSSSKPPLDDERRRWQTLWGEDSARVVRLAETDVLLMRFYKTSSSAPSTPQRQAAAKAIGRMASFGWNHTDLHWRHVGLYRDTATNDLGAVLIDLGQVAEDVVPDQAQQDMLSALGLEGLTLASIFSIFLIGCSDFNAIATESREAV
jgi:hypothetical protein